MRAAQYPYLDGAPLALAHRGGAAYGPNEGLENTVSAFRTAVDLGYRYLETDVHATSDGVIVAFHDDRLDRVSDGRGLIRDTPYAVVGAARVGGREHVPTLAELLETFPDTRFNIDVKADGAVEGTCELIERFGAQDRVCLGSFSPRRIRAIRRRIGPRVATAAGQLGTAAMRFAPLYASLLAASPAPVLQIPQSTLLRGREIRVLTEGLLALAHDLGKQVHVWFDAALAHDESAAEFDRLLDLGVDGLVVDRIDVLREVFRARGLW